MLLSGTLPKPDSGHISTMILVRQASQNGMKPRIQCGRIQLVVATVSCCGGRCGCGAEGASGDAAGGAGAVRGSGAVGAGAGGCGGGGGSCGWGAAVVPGGRGG